MAPSPEPKLNVDAKLPNMNSDEVMAIPSKVEMNRDQGPSLVAAVNSASGVPIEQSHLQPMLAGNRRYRGMDELKEQACGLVLSKKNFQALQTKRQLLMEEVAHIRSLLSKYNNAKEEVAHWLEEADEILQGTEGGILEGPDEKSLCGSCWDPITRTGEAGMILGDVERVLERRNGLDLSSYIIRRSYCNKLQSRESMLQQMLEAVEDVEINMISIYGMMGVGKTILAGEFARRLALNDHIFHAVVVVQVSESTDVRLIQSQIATEIGLHLSDGDHEETRAQLLYKALEEKIMGIANPTATEPATLHSKILFILDGLERAVELEKVGIPYGEAVRANCKVVLVSRSVDVGKNMGAKKQFLVQCLNMEEAKILFQEGLGDEIQSMEFRMENIFVTKCRGLPLVIDSLACTLRSMSSSDWEVTADQLERHNLVEVHELKEVPRPFVQMCNNFLQKGEKQKLLLLSCLMQQGVQLNAEKLRRYCIGFGLFEDCSLASATDQVNLLVDEMKSLSILLESKDSANIEIDDAVISTLSQACLDEIQWKMHDVMQEVAISALSQGEIDVLADAGTHWHTRGSYESCTAISVMTGGNDKCLNGLQLHKLEALLLKDKPSLSLSNSYFQGMKSLRILDIYGTRLAKLPSSVGYLKNLVALHLEWCEIESVSSISQLPKLEVLSLRGSKLGVSPDQIRHLTNLRVLDLTKCQGLREFHHGTLSRLDRLTELYVCGSGMIWTSIGKLNSLDLEVLEIDGIYAFRAPVDTFRLRKFILCMGLHPSLEKGISFSNVIVYKGYDRRQIEESGWLHLMHRTDMLHIVSARGLCKGVGNLSRNGFLHLKEMHIEGCSEMECLLDAEGSSMNQKDMFTKLQILTLKGCNKLERICYWTMSSTCFPKLRELTLQGLRQLHPHVLPIQHAATLRRIKVIDCPSLAFIFPALQEMGGTNRLVKLPWLETLELEDLKSLQAIQDPSMEVAHVLFNAKIEFSSLKDIHLRGLDQIRSLWDTQLYGRDPCFTSLKSIRVAGCENLECMFSTSMIDSVLQLEELEIRLCGRLMQVITQDDDASAFGVKTFPKLQTLTLEDLMSLECFYRGSLSLEFPSLRQLALASLNEMKTFVHLVSDNAQSPHTEMERTLFMEEVSLPSLEHLQVSDLNVELVQGHFPNLSSLALRALAHLKSTPAVKSNKLRSLCLEGTHCIIGPFSALPTPADSLEELILTDCNCQEYPLRSISWSRLCNLRSLSIHGLISADTYLIPAALVSGGNGLHHLQSMEVEGCRGMKVIISDEEIVDDDIVKHGLTLFPSLKCIRLSGLDHLELFCPGRYETLLPSLEAFEIFECRSFKSFTRGATLTPRLKSLLLDFQSLPTNAFHDLNAILEAMLAKKKIQREHDKGNWRR